jgi:hypothetical protein
MTLVNELFWLCLLRTNIKRTIPPLNATECSVKGAVDVRAAALTDGSYVPWLMNGFLHALIIKECVNTWRELQPAVISFDNFLLNRNY